MESVNVASGTSRHYGTSGSSGTSKMLRDLVGLVEPRDPVGTIETSGQREGGKR